MNATIITGRTAIAFASALGLDCVLCKYPDPTEGFLFRLSVEEARRIAAKDPGLIWLEVDSLVSDEDIEALRTEASAAGNAEQIALCDAAADGDAAAREKCVLAIVAAWTAADE